MQQASGWRAAQRAQSQAARQQRACGRRWRSTACSIACAAWQFLAFTFHSLFRRPQGWEGRPRRPVGAQAALAGGRRKQQARSSSRRPPACPPLLTGCTPGTAAGPRAPCPAPDPPRCGRPHRRRAPAPAAPPPAGGRGGASGRPAPRRGRSPRPEGQRFESGRGFGGTETRQHSCASTGKGRHCLRTPRSSNHLPPQPRRPAPARPAHLERIGQVLLLQHLLLRCRCGLVGVCRGAVLPQPDRAVAAAAGQQVASGPAQRQRPHLVVVGVKRVDALCRWWR